ncbi:uncharacterized protein FFB20_12803 [Fusarium fujikuroi]|nr:uncharacterized protein FFB20_12803 [Fusarium fujikuroi]SCO18808.1 uncharacterized protein FFC1_13337 [Fusarium fujikuroi]
MASTNRCVSDSRSSRLMSLVPMDVCQHMPAHGEVQVQVGER